MIATWLSRRQTFRALTVSASDISRKGVWRQEEDAGRKTKKKKNHRFANPIWANV